MDLSQFFEDRTDSGSVVEDLFWHEMKKQVERYNSYNDNVIHVTDLVRCKKRYELICRFPFLFKLEPYYVMANLVHLGLQHWLADTYGCQFEKLFSKEIDEYTIVGSVDAIDDTTVYEIKTAKSLRDCKPYEHHEMQVKIYLWLTGREHGKIIYITPDRIVEFDIEPEYDDDDILMHIDNWSSPRWEWECVYCEFNSVCPLFKKR